MKSIVVNKISLEDYATLTKAGYKINFALPEVTKKSYSVGKRMHTEHYVEPEKEVRVKVQTSIKTPYVTKYPRKQWFKEGD